MNHTCRTHAHITRLLIMAALCTMLLMLSGCQYALYQLFYRDSPVETRSTTLAEIAAPSVPAGDQWSFILITDVHFGASKQRNDSAFLDKIRAMSPSPAFCICLGDSTEHGTADEYKAFKETLADPLQAMGIPVYTIAGNHDLYNDGWKNLTSYMNPGSSFYHFNEGDVSFYFLDSASGNIGRPQLRALKNAFAGDTKQKIILSHVPLYSEDALYFTMQDSDERNELISLFANNKVSYFFCGHTHDNLFTDFGTFKEVNLPAYLAYRGYGVCTVNTASGTVTHSVQYY